MSLQDLRKLEEERVQAYLASPRNADLPELVRRWIATGEGEAQDEFILIEVGVPYVRFAPPQYCECCGTTMAPGQALCTVRWELAESETCGPASDKLHVCSSCAEEWVEASEAIDNGANDVELALQSARDAIASIPVNDATVDGRAKALAKIDEMIDRRALQRARRVA